MAKKVVKFVKSMWGEETFSEDNTSAENEMSVIQYARICDENILLTGDAGRLSLTEAAEYAPHVDLILPGIKHFQVPHHGSRRNLSTELLDILLGSRLSAKPEKGKENFNSIISVSKEDTDHPRKSVVRALIHRGAKVVTTQGSSLRTGHNAPNREGWTSAVPLEYPEDQEE